PELPAVRKIVVLLAVDPAVAAEHGVGRFERRALFVGGPAAREVLGTDDRRRRQEVAVLVVRTLEREEAGRAQDLIGAQPEIRSAQHARRVPGGLIAVDDGSRSDDAA